MAEKTYFVVSNDDGEVRIDGPMTWPAFLAMLKRDNDGVGPERVPVWLDKIQERGLQYMGERDRILIEGRIVAPRPVHVVTDYAMPEDR